MEVNIHHAKTNLSRLILQAEAGEEVIIARAGKPAVKLVPVQPPAPKKFKFGALKGLFTVPDNFLDPDPELESLFYDGQILSGVPDEELIKPQPDQPKPATVSK
ncbi:MAG TPA: type II toxin-antitoxin system Phd/YefM family antitoxin [Terracidiphilus sp.]|nr:type II toxin-antitoxin system Phd/YefM family antitoxin [Terracidiphilus sp.]